MKHSFLDRYAHQQTPFHRLDGRVKVLFFLGLILAAATTPVGWGWSLAAYALIEVAVLIVARVPLGYVASRAGVALPFVALASAGAPFLKGGEVLWSGEVLGLALSITEHGLRVAGNVIARAGVSVVALITLTSVAPMDELLESLRRLRVPKVFVMLAGFSYRYIFVLVDEAHRLRMAHQSRSFARHGLLRGARGLGRVMGTLLMRSFERAERVYQAMLSRGYDGQPVPGAKSTPAPAQVGFLACCLLILLSLRTSTLWLPRLL